MIGHRILLVRGIRTLVDSLVRVTIPAYLLLIGLTATRIGFVVAISMVGSGIATIVLSLFNRAITTRSLFIVVALLMALTGLGWSFATTAPLALLVAAIGTANIGGGDVSPFVPLEQAAMYEVDERARPIASLAKLEFVGAMVGIFGAAIAGVPILLARQLGEDELTGHRIVFGLYAVAGIAIIGVLRSVQINEVDQPRPGPIPREARRSLIRLTSLFLLDSFASGFASHAIIALWLYRRYDLSPAVVGFIFALSAMCSALSGLVAAPLAARFGEARAMVGAHAPASVLLVAMALAPTLWLAVLCFGLRSLTARIDAPIRSSVVLAIVEPHHRTFAAAVTNVPRSLVAGLPAIAAGALIDGEAVVWSFVICASLKLVYDALIYQTLRT